MADTKEQVRVRSGGSGREASEGRREGAGVQRAESGTQRVEAGAQGSDMPMREKRAQQQEGTREGLYFEPNVDIYETDQALTLVADIPGVGPEDLDIDLRENQLTIVARVGPIEERWRPLYQEYRQGHFLRQFRLGQQIDQSRISAQLRDGVLTLDLPKAESARPRKIQIGGGQSGQRREIGQGAQEGQPTGREGQRDRVGQETR